MTPLYHDPHFTFRFADDRLIPRFHLDGVEAGQRVSVFKIDPGSGERLGLLATATVGEGGWVDLAEPIIVRAGDAFVAVPRSIVRCLHDNALASSPGQEDYRYDREDQGLLGLRLTVLLPGGVSAARGRPGEGGRGRVDALRASA